MLGPCSEIPYCPKILSLTVPQLATASNQGVSQIVLQYLHDEWPSVTNPGLSIIGLSSSASQLGGCCRQKCYHILCCVSKYQLRSARLGCQTLQNHSVNIDIALGYALLAQKEWAMMVNALWMYFPSWKVACWHDVLACFVGLGVPGDLAVRPVFMNFTSHTTTSPLPSPSTHNSLDFIISPYPRRPSPHYLPTFWSLPQSSRPRESDGGIISTVFLGTSHKNSSPQKYRHCTCILIVVISKPCAKA